MTINKYLLGGIAVALVAVFVIGADWYRTEEQVQVERNAAEQPAERLVRPHSPTLGPATAPVTLVEFLDPECEACRAMHPIVKRVLQEFEGRVRLVVRYATFHRNSRYAAGLLEAAREQNKYWELMDVFFARQPEWASHGAPKPELLMDYVRASGLDARRLSADVGQGEIERRIRQDMEDVAALGVRQTPTFFVNGRPLPQIGYEPLRGAIADALR
jgi:protein-disulfide isomerase